MATIAMPIASPAASDPTANSLGVRVVGRTTTPVLQNAQAEKVTRSAHVGRPTLLFRELPGYGEDLARGALRLPERPKARLAFDPLQVRHPG